MKRLDLLIPGLFDLPAAELDERQLATVTPGLHHILRFASKRPDDRPGFEDRLNRLLGLDRPGLSYAEAVLGPDKQSGLLFSVVNLRADINNAVIQPVTDFNGDITNIINDLSAYFKVDCDISALADDIWSMRLKEIQPVTGMPHVYYALGRKVSHYLDLARDQLDWFRFFNEMQMFLHQHPLNEARLAAGLPMVNSLWCWGAEPWNGEKNSILTWYSDEPEIQALGRLYAARSESIAALPTDRDTGRGLLVDLRLLKALKAGSDVSLMQTLIAIEQQYLARLAGKRISLVNLYAGAQISLQYQSGMRFKLWRPKPLLSDFQPL